MNIRIVALITILCSFFISCDKKEETKAANQEKDWIYQVDSLLMPYWMMEEALGDPMGNFPAYRNNSGQVIRTEEFDFSSVPSYLKTFIIDQTDSLQRDFLRIKSRQIFAYGVAYHLTGNEEYLKLAKTGVDYIIENGVYETGAPVSFWQDGIGRPDILQRTSQDLAYSLTGLAMYYYLTRDQEIFKTILKVKQYIYLQYYEESSLSENSKLFMWVKEDFEGDKTTSKQLVATLDQLNAYLILLAPILPDSLEKSFDQDMLNTSYVLKDNFYNETNNIFWGDLNDKSLSQFQTDFGHSIKTLWMIYLTGKHTGENELTDFAEKNARKLLTSAYLKNRGSWAYKYKDSTLTVDKGSFWWTYAELDQMCATLSFTDTTLYTKYLSQTYRYWQDHMIDKVHKETWLGLDENGDPVDLLLKASHWKNGYHSLEHALIGHLSTANYLGNETPLYYAFKKDMSIENEKIRPYYFNAEIKNSTKLLFESAALKDLQKTKVTFGKIFL